MFSLSQTTLPQGVRSRERSIATLASALLHGALIAALLLLPTPPALPQPENQPGEMVLPVSLPAWQQVIPAPETEKEPAPVASELGPDTDRPEEPAREAGPETLQDPDLIDPSRPLNEEPPPSVVTARPPAVPETRAANPVEITGPKPLTSNLLRRPVSPMAFAPPATRADNGSGSSASADVSTGRSVIGRVGLSPNEAQSWRPSFNQAAGRCVEIPDLGVDESGQPILATVVGRVFRSDHVTPLAGAQLQIVGTSFMTWSDQNGVYQLRFNPRLLEKCRVQYVQVRAEGYQGELLTLSIGEKVQSDDVVLHRK